MKLWPLLKAWWQNDKCSRRLHRLYHPVHDDTFQSFNIVDGRFFPPIELREGIE